MKDANETHLWFEAILSRVQIAANHITSTQRIVDLLSPRKVNLEQEMERLVGQHGKAAVAAAAKKATKPNLRKDMEREDRRVLGQLLKREAEKELAGEPTLSNVALAEEALSLVPHSCRASGHRRLMNRLGKGWRTRVQAVLKIEIAVEKHPCSVLVNACMEGATIKGVERLANETLDEIARCVNALRNANKTIDGHVTLPELRKLLAALDPYSAHSTPISGQWNFWAPKGGEPK